MESRSKIFGHPAHQILIVFPLGLLFTAVVFDGLHAAGKSEKQAEVADALIGAGLIGGAVAAPFGLWDWLAIPEGTRAKEIGRWHGLGNAVVLGLFGASWLLRRKSPQKPGAVPIALSVAGAGLAMVTGWLGGELVDRLGVGVDDGAHLDAPNSLSGLPADETPELEMT